MKKPTIYYNEFDPFASQWLRELMKDKLIPDGVVDDRSILDVEAKDLEGFTQCHFFAGIGGWSYALQLAGWATDRPVWTASLPCQPFSVAGAGAGKDDDRHLLPHFMHLAHQCRPHTIFGEQVEGAVRHGWLDDLYAEMEREGYTVGASVLGAHSVQSYHQRQRIYWVAHASDTRLERGVHRPQSTAIEGREEGREPLSTVDGNTSPLADTHNARLQGHGRFEQGDDTQGRAKQMRHNSQSSINDSPVGNTEGTGRETRPTDRVGDADHSCRDERDAPCASQWDSPLGNTERHGSSADQVGRSTGESEGEGRVLQRQGSDTNSTLGNAQHNGSSAVSGGSGSLQSGASRGSKKQEFSGESEGTGGSDKSADIPGCKDRCEQWSDIDLVYCRDGKYRPIPAQPDVQPVVDGFSDRLVDLSSEDSQAVTEAITGYPTVKSLTPNRVGILKGAGNAIVPQVGAEFIQAYMEIIDDEV